MRERRIDQTVRSYSKIVMYKSMGNMETSRRYNEALSMHTSNGYVNDWWVPGHRSSNPHTLRSRRAHPSGTVESTLGQAVSTTMLVPQRRRLYEAITWRNGQGVGWGSEGSMQDGNAYRPTLCLHVRPLGLERSNMRLRRTEFPP